MFEGVTTARRFSGEGWLRGRRQMLGVTWVALLVSALSADASLAQSTVDSARASVASALSPNVDPWPKAGASPLSVPARTWASETAANEVTIIEHKGSYLRYRMHVVDAKGDQVRDVIESRDGTVARAILRNGRPLTPAEDKDERARLEAMLDSPAAFAKHVRGDVSGKKLAVELIRQLPDAMLYTYTEGQPQVAGATSGGQVVIDFKPNPKYSPPSTTAEALSGLAGRVWIDTKSRRMIRLEANIFQGVNIGWGMVAHIYPGGKLSVDQTNAGGQRWIFTHFSEHVTLRALMVKTMNEQAQIDAQDFQTMEPMSYQDAIHVLLNTPLPAR